LLKTFLSGTSSFRELERNEQGCALGFLEMAYRAGRFGSAPLFALTSLKIANDATSAISKNIHKLKYDADVLELGQKSEKSANAETAAYFKQLNYADERLKRILRRCPPLAPLSLMTQKSALLVGMVYGCAIRDLKESGAAPKGLAKFKLNI
jgi:predicted Zn-dependent protease